MARPRIEPNPENASIRELRETARAGSPETSTRCTAIQLPVCAALLVSERAVSKWIHAFNESGIDGPIGKKRTGRPRKIPPAHTAELADAAEHPGRAGRTVWTASAFHGRLREHYRLECSLRTVVRFLREQNSALKVPQPRPDRQDEKPRQAFRERLAALAAEARTGLWFTDESGFEGECRARRRSRFPSLLDHAAIEISPKRKRNPLIPGNASRRKKKAFAGESSNPNIFRPARRISIPSNASGL